MVLETFRLANDFTWDRANGIVFDDVIVNQGDANGRKMRVQVVDGQLKIQSPTIPEQYL